MVMMMAKQKNASAWTAAGSLRAWLIAGSSSDRCLLPRLRVARCDRFETKNVAQRRRRPDLEGSPLSHPPSVSLAKHTARPPATSEATATSAGRTTALMWWGSVLWKVKLARVCWVKWRRFVAASQNAPPYMPASNRHGSGAYRTLGWPAWAVPRDCWRWPWGGKWEASPKSTTFTVRLVVRSTLSLAHQCSESVLEAWRWDVCLLSQKKAPWQSSVNLFSVTTEWSASQVLVWGPGGRPSNPASMPLPATALWLCRQRGGPAEPRRRVSAFPRSLKLNSNWKKNETNHALLEGAFLRGLIYKILHSGSLLDLQLSNAKILVL